MSGWKPHYQPSLWWRHPLAQKGIAAYNALRPREQILLQIILHAVVLALFSLLLLQPLWQRSMALQQTTVSQQQQNQQLHNQLEQLRLQAINDPNQPLRDELARLQVQQTHMNQRITALTDALVSPAQMVPLLEQMLKQDKRLQLKSLVNLPRQPLELGEEFADVQLYSHHLRLTLDASYDGLLAYLQRLDAMPWRLFWQSLDFHIVQHPRGELTLEVYTLSMREEVLGG
ncbi:type II secretion system protein GspM [Thalassolituus pacificus]|jgi:MSHA biogenesis protein MshJ|uniref:MSHA biogenesis protein MshJ n=1 Tax=Thalassolituus pacificus TaxID=2975440 RepID=A0A9X2WHA7_9GAMM|nr:type II secretion system protein GspM [Thalassolituus pacificus]MCT7360456.1 hypothetical protein [Thalassolituus pacificus]